MDKRKGRPDATDLLGGTLNILGLTIDLGELLQAPENLKGRLEELRERLKAAGGKEVLSGEAWQKGGATITGHIRTRGLLGEREFHIGTLGRAGRDAKEAPAPQPPETVEPPVDVFDEGKWVTIVADVPGVTLEDLEVKVEGSTLSLSTRPTARRSYRKELRLQAELDPEGLQSACRNGVLEVRVRKRGKGKSRSRRGETARP